MSQTWHGRLQTKVSSLLENCAYCVTAAGTGLSAGHAGCVITPIVTSLAPWGEKILVRAPVAPPLILAASVGFNVAMGGVCYWARNKKLGPKIRMAASVATAFGLAATAVTGSTMAISVANYQPLMMFGIGTGITGATLVAWYAWRGRHVSPFIRNVTFGIAAASLLGMTAIRTPHMYDMWRTYQELTAQGQSRNDLIAYARSNGQGLDAVIDQLCSSPNKPWNRMSYAQKIEASYPPVILLATAAGLALGGLSAGQSFYRQRKSRLSPQTSPDFVA